MYIYIHCICVHVCRSCVCLHAMKHVSNDYCQIKIGIVQQLIIGVYVSMGNQA